MCKANYITELVIETIGNIVAGALYLLCLVPDWSRGLTSLVRQEMIFNLSQPWDAAMGEIRVNISKLNENHEPFKPLLLNIHGVSAIKAW
ncbi:hypothetical protein ACOSP7_004552 [Xanthoceras sorbifolium]